MNQSKAINLNSILSHKEKIINFLFFAIIFLSFVYVFFLHKAIANVVERESVVKETRVVSTRVSDLESKYFQVKNTISIELAHEKGFKDSDAISFISKKSLTAMVQHHEL